MGEGQIGRLRLTLIHKIDNENLLYSTGNSTQHSAMVCMAYMGKEAIFEK